MDNRAIGVFDSGVGGLTVVRQLTQVLPNEEILYLGDTLNVPYGCKNFAQLNRFAENNMKFFLSQNVKAVLIACGTISTNCYGHILELTDIPVMEIVTAGAEAACNAAKNKIGLIATEATVNSGAHKRIMEKAGMQVFGKACPLFTPIIEEGLWDTAIAQAAAEYYLDELSAEGIDTLLLGCTHYPLMWDAIQSVFPDGVTLVDPAAEIANRFAKMLSANNMLREDKGVKHRFCVTGNPERFSKILGMVIGEQYVAEKVVL